MLHRTEQGLESTISTYEGIIKGHRKKVILPEMVHIALQSFYKKVSDTAKDADLTVLEGVDIDFRNLALLELDEVTRHTYETANNSFNLIMYTFNSLFAYAFNLSLQEEFQFGASDRRKVLDVGNSDLSRAGTREEIDRSIDVIMSMIHEDGIIRCASLSRAIYFKDKESLMKAYEKEMEQFRISHDEEVSNFPFNSLREGKIVKGIIDELTQNDTICAIYGANHINTLANALISKGFNLAKEERVLCLPAFPKLTLS